MTRWSFSSWTSGEVLGRRPSGTEESFFALGGHSLLAISLVARIEERFGTRLPLATVMERPTVALQAEVLRGTPPSAAPTPLVAIQRRGGQRPLFCVHPGGGTAFCYLPLARHLGPDQPCYGLQSPGMSGEVAPLARVEAMASAYVEAVKTVEPGGPYRLAGWSFGGLVAYEMARRLRAGGDLVEALILIDTPAPGSTAIPAEIDDAALLQGIAREVAAWNDGTGDAGPAVDSPEALLALAKASRLLPSEAGIQHLVWLLGIFRANLCAAAAYRPGAYPGTATLLRAAVPPGDDPTLGWAALVTGGLEVREMPGDHFAVVREPEVEVVARAVGDCLRS